MCQGSLFGFCWAAFTFWFGVIVGGFSSAFLGSVVADFADVACGFAG